MRGEHGGRRRWLPIVLLVAVLGCGETTTSPGTGSSAVTSEAAAAEDFDRFFQGAEAVHAALVTAEDELLAGRDPSSGEFTVVPTLPRAELDSLARAIPAGLPADVEHRLVLVYMNLDARLIGLVRVADGDVPEDGPKFCLDGVASNRDLFAGLLNDAQNATSGVSVPTVPADSAAAGELAARLALVEIANGGCLSCGIDMANPSPNSFDLATPIPVDWEAREVDGIPFEAEFVDGEWVVEINAC
jgi:hypothetical protein